MINYRQVILIIIFITAIFNIFGTIQLKKSAGPPPYYTGAPSESTCTFAGCHDGVTGIDNIGNGSCNITIGNNYSTYSLGDTFDIQVNVQHPGCDKFGFQVVALEDISGAPAGNAYVKDAIRTQRRDNTNVSWGCCPNRQWIEHTAAGNQALAMGATNWIYKWVAPTTNVGPITFYLSALAADGNGNDSLDYTYTKTKTVTFDQNTFIPKLVPLSEIQVYPNPASNFITIENTASFKWIKLVDLNGKSFLISCNGNNRTLLNISCFPSGLYLLYSKGDSESAFTFLSKFIKQ